EIAGERAAAVDRELMDGGEGVGTGGNATDSDEEDVHERVLPGPLDTRVLKIHKVLVEGGRSAVGHELLLGEDDRTRAKSHRSTVQKARLSSLRMFSILMRRPCFRSQPDDLLHEEFEVGGGILPDCVDAAQELTQGIAELAASQRDSVATGAHDAIAISFDCRLGE